MEKPEKIGQYTILKFLGQGSVATVFEAEHILVKRRAAIKVLKHDTHQNDFSQEDFVEEARKLAQLESPNIVNMYEFGFHENSPYFAMEIVDGGDLHSLVESRGRPDQTIASLILGQILEGLHSAHLKNIIHRDLSTKNVLINKQGNVKITDFGISMDGGQVKGNHTNKGTIQFLSPEHLSTSTPTPASDLFSLGSIAYYLFTGKYPFQGKDRDEIFQNILTRSYDSLHTFNSSLSPDLVDFCHICFGESLDAPSYQKLTNKLKSFYKEYNLTISEGPWLISQTFFAHSGERDFARQIMDALNKNQRRVALNILNNALTLFPQSPVLTDLISRIQTMPSDDPGKLPEQAAGPNTVGFTQDLMTRQVRVPASAVKKKSLYWPILALVMAVPLIIVMPSRLKQQIPPGPEKEVRLLNALPDSTELTIENKIIKDTDSSVSAAANRVIKMPSKMRPLKKVRSQDQKSIVKNKVSTPVDTAVKPKPVTPGIQFPPGLTIGADSAALQIAIANARVNLNGHFLGFNKLPSRIYIVKARIYSVTVETPEYSFRRAIPFKAGRYYYWDPLNDIFREKEEKNKEAVR